MKFHLRGLKSCFAKLREADLISSEAAHRRFHSSSLGFHPAKQDFIKFVWLAGIVLSLQAFLLLAVKILFSCSIYRNFLIIYYI